MEFSQVKDYKKIINRWFDSYKDFCKECLGLGSIRKQGEQYHNMNHIHEYVCDRIQHTDKKSVLILMPRHSFKSWIITIGYSLWNLVQNPNFRVLVYSDTAEKAWGFLQGIKNHIFGESPNTRFRLFFNNWETDPHKGKWNERQIVVSPRTDSNIEPSVDTGGIESTKVGKHYDLILFDDIVSDINTTTKAQMDKVHNCYKKALSLLSPTGKVVIVGTRWSFGDAYGRIIAENDEKKNFEVITYDAEQRNDEGKLIFEDIGLDRKFLEYQRKEQGSILYSALYRNNPASDETAIFKEDNFTFYKLTSGFHKNMFITCVVDPAGEGEDFTGITVCATDKRMKIHILDAVMAHLKPHQITNHIIRLNYKWGFNRFGIETNFFRGIYEDELRRSIAEESKNKSFNYFSIEELMASNRNRTFSKVLSLQPFHERGDLLFPGKNLLTLPSVFMELATQMMQFTIDGPKSPHDDLIKSLAWHTDIINRGGEAEKDDPPETSPAWFEQQQVEAMYRRNRSVPSKYRTPIIPVFS